MALFDANTMGRAIAEGIRQVFPISGGGDGGGMPPFAGNLIRVGDRGEAVRQVQSCLNRVSLSHPAIQRLTADGIFGPRTFDAVVAFQRIFGLNPDGVIGPITWARLRQECADSGTGGGGSGGVMPPFPGANLQLGSRGESVRQVQHCLNQVSQPCSRQLTEDGAFGPLTQAAVITFQRIFELTPNGIVGSITWGRLAQECGAGGTVATLASGDCHCGCGCDGNPPALDQLPPGIEDMDPNQMLLFMLLQRFLQK